MPAIKEVKCEEFSKTFLLAEPISPDCLRFEFGEHKGLGLISGEIRPLTDVVPSEYKIPHIGWNALSFGERKHSLFRYVNEGDHVYFVHSYYGAKCADSVIAVTEYGATVTAAVANGNVMGCQFHPEKSGNVGLAILRAFCETENFR